MTAVLAGRTALVTGGAGAIGLAIARRFASEGARVVVADIDGARCSALAGTLTAEFGVDAIGVGMDVTDPHAVDEVAASVTRDFGVCDAIVPNAGILVLAPALKITPAQWSSVLAVNLSGAFFTATAFARHLVTSGRPGTIVFMSSLFGVRGGRGNAAYSASKFGVLGLSQSLAAELASDRIRVNAVCPGQISTAMLDDLFARRAAESGLTVEEEEQAFAERIPLGGLGSVDDVARAFVYLSHEASSYVTGQHIVVDGGWQVGP